jgi:hypothetical protein
MKFAPLAALGLAAVAVLTVPAFAEETAETAAPMAAAFTIDTPIETLVADARAKAVLDKHVAGIDQHTAYDQFKAISLKSLAPFSQGLITDEVLAKIAADLAAIK